MVLRNSFLTPSGSQGFSSERERVVALARRHSVRKSLGMRSLSIDIEIHKFHLVDRVPLGRKPL